MKKNYIVPATTILNVTVQQMIAGSQFTVNGEGDLTGGTLQNENAGSAALSRGSIWDNEEDED